MDSCLAVHGGARHASPVLPLSGLPSDVLARVVVRLPTLVDFSAFGRCNVAFASFTEPILRSVICIVGGGSQAEDLPDQARFVLTAALHMYVRKLLRQVELGRVRLRGQHLQALFACAQRQSEGLRLRQMIAAHLVGSAGMDHQAMLHHLSRQAIGAPHEAMAHVLPFFRRPEPENPYQRMGDKLFVSMLRTATTPVALIAELTRTIAALPPEYESLCLTGLLELASRRLEESALAAACGMLTQAVLALPPMWRVPPLLLLLESGWDENALDYPVLLHGLLECVQDLAACRFHRLWHALPCAIELAERQLDAAHCLHFNRGVLARSDTLLCLAREEPGWWLWGRHGAWPQTMCRWISGLEDAQLRTQLWQQLKAHCDAFLPGPVGLDEIMTPRQGRDPRCELV